MINVFFGTQAREEVKSKHIVNRKLSLWKSIIELLLWQTSKKGKLIHNIACFLYSSLLWSNLPFSTAELDANQISLDRWHCKLETSHFLNCQTNSENQEMKSSHQDCLSQNINRIACQDQALYTRRAISPVLLFCLLSIFLVLCESLCVHLYSHCVAGSKHAIMPHLPTKQHVLRLWIPWPVVQPDQTRWGRSRSTDPQLFSV